MRKNSINPCGVFHSVLSVAILFSLLSLLFGNTFASVHANPYLQPRGTITTSQIALYSGTTGDSTIYTNSTSATVTVQPSWYDPGWGYRRRITVDHTKVQASLTAFPVLISLSSDSDLSSRAQSSGNDILFTASNGTTKLSHEIEKYNSSTGALVAWVKTDLSNLADTDVYMYYGNSSVGSQQDARNVWDSNFKGVWHLKEDPFGAAPQMKDSTSNGNNGTSSGSMTTSDQVTGEIDGSLDFDGSNDEATCGNAASLQITTEITIEAWAKTSVTSAVKGMVNKETSSYVGYQLRKHSDNHYRFATGNPTTLNQYVTSNLAYTDSNWHCIVGVRRSGTNYLYIDGVQQTATSTGAITDSGANFDIGRAYSNYNGYWWTGGIDEVRVSNVGRDASWIGTCYNNQNSPSTFYSVDSPSTYNYVLRVANQDTNAWNVSLQVYSSSNIARISSTTISFHDGTSSDQIIVSNGNIVQPQGALYNLAVSQTIYISMSNVQANASGTSHIYVYLKVLKPSTSTYGLYVITFRIR